MALRTAQPRTALRRNNHKDFRAIVALDIDGTLVRPDHVLAILLEADRQCIGVVYNTSRLSAWAMDGMPARLGIHPEDVYSRCALSKTRSKIRNLRRIGIRFGVHPTRICLVDNSKRNVSAVRKAGFRGVIVHDTSDGAGLAHLDKAMRAMRVARQ